MTVEAEETLTKATELLMRELKGFRCLVCHNDEFVLFDQPGQQVRSNLMFFEGDDPVAKKHIPTLSIACARCGRIEQFAEKPLVDRLVAQGDKQS